MSPLQRCEVTVLLSGGRPEPVFARGWAAHPLPELPNRPGFRMLVSPSAG
ncbi:hypothetical protein [Streptomyces sp. CC210A]|nr:hypothetical protein [Streptomyces sp. CC210A]